MLKVLIFFFCVKRHVKTEFLKDVEKENNNGTEWQTCCEAWAHSPRMDLYCFLTPTFLFEILGKIQYMCIKLRVIFLYFHLTLSTLGKIYRKRYIEFFLFPQKTEFDMSCQLSPIETLCLKCQILFSGRNKKNIIILSSAKLAQRVVMVKYNISPDKQIRLA